MFEIYLLNSDILDWHDKKPNNAWYDTLLDFYCDWNIVLIFWYNIKKLNIRFIVRFIVDFLLNSLSDSLLDSLSDLSDKL